MLTWEIREAILEALLRPNLAQDVARQLTTIEDPWLALEAETHIALLPEEGSAPDWVALEARLLALMAKAGPEPQLLLEELGQYGLLPPTGSVSPPVLSHEFQTRLAAVPPRIVNQFVETINQDPNVYSREQLDELLLETMARYHLEEDLLVEDIVYCVVMHSALSRRILTLYAEQEDARIRQAVARHPQADDAVRACCHKKAVTAGVAQIEMISSGLLFCGAGQENGILDEGEGERDGVSYFLLRYCPGALTEFEKHGNLARFLRKGFASRLGLAFALETALIQFRPFSARKYRMLRERLKEDPNRYVRGALDRDDGNA
jgi:hypothetical protein